MPATTGSADEVYYTTWQRTIASCLAAFLEYAADPEIVGEKQLIVSIAAKQDIEDIFDALKHLDHDWWFEANDQADDDLCITVGY